MKSRRGRSGALSAVLLVAAHAASAAPPDNLAQLRAQALELVNQSREEQGLPPLEQGDTLNEAAQAHADDMLSRGYYAHVAPDGTTPLDRYVAAGGSRWRLVQENIARCAQCRPPAAADDIEALHSGWMKSPEHRENILASGIDRFGFGIALDPQQGLYAVQTFAGPGIPPAQTDGTGEPLTPDEQIALGLELVNEARREAGVTPLERSDALASTARSLLSDQRLKTFALDGIEDVTQAMPAAERGDWLALSMVTASCGGCGPRPTAANLRSFVRRWLDNPGRRDLLLDPAQRQFGLAMRADGEGKQLAVALVGRSR